MRKIGTTITTTTLGETARAFRPQALPPEDSPLAPESYRVASLVASVNWPLDGAIRKEVVLTCQIEGTKATMTDLFDDEAGQLLANMTSIEEVTNDLRASRLVRDKLRNEAGLLVSVRLMCDACRLLLDGARGATKHPGELRRKQNGIGNTRPGRAAFVPPPPDEVPGLLADSERFVYDAAPALLEP